MSIILEESKAGGTGLPRGENPLFILDTFSDPMLDLACSDDVEVHEEQVTGGENIHSYPNQYDGIENFSVFAGHWVLERLINGRVKLASRLLYCQG